jgi:hypothetical protein
MTKQAIIGAFLTVIIAAGLVAASLAGDGLRRSKGRQKNSTGAVLDQLVEVKDIPQRDIPQGDAAAIPFGWPRPLTFQPKKAVAEQLRQFHQRLADLMNRAKLLAPAHRLQQFKWLDTPRFRLEGWYATVKGAEETPDGYLVTVMVSPLASSSLGASTTILNAVRELYAVNVNGHVSFVGPLDAVDSVEPSIITD